MKAKSNCGKNNPQGGLRVLECGGWDGLRGVPAFCLQQTKYARRRKKRAAVREAQRRINAGFDSSRSSRCFTPQCKAQNEPVVASDTLSMLRRTKDPVGDTCSRSRQSPGIVQRARRCSRFGRGSTVRGGERLLFAYTG